MDEVEVVNSALGLLGERRITSFADGTDLAAKVNLRFPLVRDGILEMHPWNFAMYRTTLAQSDQTPVSGWSYQYPLPTNPWCIKVRDVNPDTSPPVAWEVGVDSTYGRVLLTDESTVSIRYTGRQLDFNIWSPVAVLAFTYLLASDFAVTITGQQNKANLNREMFQLTIASAITSDGREGTPVVVSAPTTLTAIR